MNPLHWDREEVIFQVFLERKQVKSVLRTRKILSDIKTFTNMYITGFNLFLLLLWVQKYQYDIAMTEWAASLWMTQKLVISGVRITSSHDLCERNALQHFGF